MRKSRTDPITNHGDYHVVRNARASKYSHNPRESAAMGLTRDDIKRIASLHHRVGQIDAVVTRKGDIKLVRYYDPTRVK